MTDINFACASCGQNLDAPEDMAGTTVSCPSCSAQIVIPSAREHAPISNTTSTAETSQANLVENARSLLKRVWASKWRRPVLGAFVVPCYLFIAVTLIPPIKEYQHPDFATGRTIRESTGSYLPFCILTLLGLLGALGSSAALLSMRVAAFAKDHTLYRRVFGTRVLVLAIMLLMLQKRDFAAARGHKEALNYRRSINWAKDMWAMEHNAAVGTPVTGGDLHDYLSKEGVDLRRSCLSGGRIMPGTIGEEPQCSVHGDMSNPKKKTPWIFYR